MAISMEREIQNSPAVTAPRVGVPFRSAKEEAQNKSDAYDKYLRAIQAAGGQPVEISLGLRLRELEALARSLDAVVLPGSSADVDPGRYHAARHPRSADPDPQREQTDFALLDHMFAEGKPVLAICYGVQLLNVYLNGTLVQDIASELAAPLKHDWSNREAGAPEPFHLLRIEAACDLARLAAAPEAHVNSSHHQAIREPGRDLRVVARAPDGVLEAVEWTGNSAWVRGVQWHPERMPGDPLAAALFHELVAAARGALLRG